MHPREQIVMVEPSTGMDQMKATTTTFSSELYDEDGGLLAIRADGMTRNKARYIFAVEHGYDYAEIRVRKGAYRDDPDYRREMADDGIPEPYDGWPLFECGPNEQGVPYWILERE